jgi:hypothetical protein
MPMNHQQKGQPMPDNTPQRKPTPEFLQAVEGCLNVTRLYIKQFIPFEDVLPCLTVNGVDVLKALDDLRAETLKLK